MWLVWAWAIILLGMTGCTVISQDRVFPKLSWYWTKDAQRQREENKLYSQPHTNKPPIAMPPLPQSVPVTTKARTAKAAIPSLPPT
jgi:hypothetical protein